jgi:hypothetical protein
VAACVAFCLIIAWLPSETGGARVGLAAGGLAAICATFAGIPAAYWAFSTGRRKLVQWMALGAAAGAVPMLVVLAGGTLGALLRGEPGVLRAGPASLISFWLRAVGVPDVLVRGHGFATLELFQMFLGSVTGSLFWLLFVRRRKGQT